MGSVLHVGYRDSSYDLYIQRLGNLTLTKENSKLSNNLFSEKQQEYEESNYKLTRLLTKYKDWTSKEIQARSVKLSEMAVDIWPLPAKYNEEKELKVARSGVVFTLDDDSELFNGTKPSNIMFFDEVINVSSWIEVYTEVHQRLFGIAPELYPKFLSTDDNIKDQIMSRNPEEFGKSFPLSDDLFLNCTYRNAKRLMKKLRVFLDFYAANTEDDKDIINELLFELA